MKLPPAFPFLFLPVLYHTGTSQHKIYGRPSSERGFQRGFRGERKDSDRHIEESYI